MIPLTSELGGSRAVGRGLPPVLVLFKLLHPAHVEAAVALGHAEDEQVEDLALLHHRQLHLGPGEALGVVAVEARLPHVDAGDEQLVLGPIRPGRQEGPLHHGQGGVAAPLGHHAGQRDVLTLLGHREGRRRDGDVNGQTQICRDTDEEFFAGSGLTKPMLVLSACSFDSRSLNTLSCFLFSPLLFWRHKWLTTLKRKHQLRLLKLVRKLYFWDCFCCSHDFM